MSNSVNRKRVRHPAAVGPGDVKADLHPSFRNRWAQPKAGELFERKRLLRMTHGQPPGA